MITKNDFLQEFNGHYNAYSSYTVLMTNMDKLIDVLNEIDPDMVAGSGKADDKSISFEICKQMPNLISDITEKLNCVGFADIGGWYGAGYFVATENGTEYNDFTAEWTDDSPLKRDDDDVPDEEADWDAFVTITDNKTGVIFYTGEGAVDYETMQMWENLINTH